MTGAQLRGQARESERLSAGGGPPVGRRAEHAGDAQEHLGLLLCWQRVAQVRVGERSRFVDATGGVE